MPTSKHLENSCICVLPTTGSHRYMEIQKSKMSLCMGKLGLRRKTDLPQLTQKWRGRVRTQICEGSLWSAHLSVQQNMAWGRFIFRGCRSVLVSLLGLQAMKTQTMNTFTSSQSGESCCGGQSLAQVVVATA